MTLFVWIVGYNFENELVAGRITNFMSFEKRRASMKAFI